jgi:ubiquitin C-terminal hydrolase
MLAMDCESHCLSCPTFIANVEKQRNSPSPPEVRSSGVRKSRRTASPTSPGDGTNNEVYCTLCQVELHFKQVHAATQNVAPLSFVHGFLDHVAPWFKLGVQEDSHEFLRLLIEAMQKSCDEARKTKLLSGHRTMPPTTPTSSDASTEYPFKLFRGTVESNVVCDSCQATSAKIDPIEDIGLEVCGHSGSTLSDVHSAFSTFSRQESLEGYKCDKCNILGTAKKQSRLASIPPILTLHLKRFRYGSDGKPMEQRRGREVHQLLGASGSAKIEGHVKFLEIFDLKPFLTESLQAQHKSMFCRLFAVIVHAGKNSHSGHYIAYVRNLSKNEWWKMDDSRVTRATSQEVLSAEAYMLFYRIVDHPISKELREKTEQHAMPKVVVDDEEEDVLPQDVEPTFSIPNKRKQPDFGCGEEWAKQKTRLPPYCDKVFRRAEEFISDHIEFKPEFFKLIMEEAEAGRKHGPSSLCGECVLCGSLLLLPLVGLLMLSCLQ